MVKAVNSGREPAARGRRSQSRRIYLYSRFYHRLGANVLAVEPHTKKPLDSWKPWQTVRQTAADRDAQPWPWAGGVSVISGVGGWRAFDFDHCPTAGPVARLLVALGLPPDYRWVVRSGSGRGWHVWIVCPEPLPAGALPAKTRDAGVYTAPGRGFDHLELRWQHCHTVAPPSLHASGRRYRFVRGRPAGAPDMVSADRVGAAFHAVTRPRDPSRAAQGIAVCLHGVPPRPGDPYAELKRRFDLLAYAQEHWPGPLVAEGNDVRIPGYGGLLLRPAWGVWYCFLDKIGGDAIDLVGYARYGTDWDRHQRGMFRAAVQEAATFAGVPRSVPGNSGGRQILVTIALPAGEGTDQEVSAPPPTGAAATVPEKSTGQHMHNRRRSHPSASLPRHSHLPGAPAAHDRSACLA
jgi:hypothetical protein